MSTPLGQLSACSYRVVRPVLPIDRCLGRLGEPFIHLSRRIVPKPDKFISRLEEQIETLEIFPNRCALIPENEILGTRYRHMVMVTTETVFRVARRTVYVLRVIHGARLLDTSMFEELE